MVRKGDVFIMVDPLVKGFDSFSHPFKIETEVAGFLFAGWAKAGIKGIGVSGRSRGGKTRAIDQDALDSFCASHTGYVFEILLSDLRIVWAG